VRRGRARPTLFPRPRGTRHNTSLPKTSIRCDVADEDVAEGRGCDATYCACPLGKTVDERSLKDGAGPEAVVVGEACGCHIMVTATEKQGTAFVFDVSIPASPDLLFVQHLSPASETKNPSVAYDDGTLGEVDPESMTFLAAADSPTGYAGVMFAGAWSGTLSLYEFKKAPRAIPPRLATCPLTLTLPTCAPTSGGRQQVQHLPRGVHPRPQLPGDPGPARTSLRLDRDLPGGLRRCVRRNVPQGALVKSALCSTRSPTRRVITLRGTQRTWLSWMSSLPAQPLYLAIFVAPMGRSCVADPIVRSGFTPGSCPWEPRQPLVATSRLRTSYDCKEPETSQVLNVPPKRGALLAWCDD